MSTFRITKSKVDALVAPISGQVILRDSELKGFGVRITSGGTRAFIIEKRVAGRLRRFTLAKYPELTVEQARKQAQVQLGKIATGIDPVAEKKAQRVGRLTLTTAFNDFKVARRNLSPKTLSLYQWAHDCCLKTWQDKVLSDITKDQVLKRHNEIGQERGEHTANFAMHFLSSVFSFAKEYYEKEDGSPIVVRNPVDAIRRNRAWYPTTRRQTALAPEQFKPWHDGVMKLKASGDLNAKAVADYFLLLLFTGLRRNEAATLKVGDIEMKRRLLTVARTKNKKPLVLPLPNHLLANLALLTESKDSAAFLFPSTSSTGHLVQPYRHAQKVAEWSGVKFTLHDLRRTFITVAEGLDISMLAIKRLVNHANSDVTSGYVVMDTERLRVPMERISAAMLRYISGESSAQVLKFGAV